jgi:hypothetical protein
MRKARNAHTKTVHFVNPERTPDRALCHQFSRDPVGGMVETDEQVTCLSCLRKVFLAYIREED